MLPYPEDAGKSGTFFTVVQIGLNAVAILGGIVGMQRFLRPFTACSFSTCPPNLPSR